MLKMHRLHEPTSIRVGSQRRIKHFQGFRTYHGRTILWEGDLIQFVGAISTGNHRNPRQLGQMGTIVWYRTDGGRGAGMTFIGVFFVSGR